MQKFFDVLLAFLMSPLLIIARSRAARESADAQAEVYRRAQQAEDEGMPDLARQLRDYAATLGVETKPEQLALSETPANGTAAPALPAPKRGRPRKEGQEQ